jgi:hypothetical protein
MRPALSALVLLLALAFPASAQEKAKSETTPGKGSAPAEKSAVPAKHPEIIRDLSRLPDKVRQTRQRILEAARSGDIDKVVTVMQSMETLPVFSFGGERDPAEYWKTNYPDSDGLEVLGILMDVLESPFVHVDVGTPQEMYVWPYFYGVPLNSLTPPQKVELFRLVTGSDWREMNDFGAYIFFRVGIAPDGVWHFFVAGD